MSRALLLSLLVLALFPAAAQEADAPSPDALVGDWKGALQPVPGVKLRLILRVKAGDAGLTAAVDSVDQGANGLPVDAIALKGRAVTFTMKRLAASYAGELSADGKTIKGEFTQAGRALPLDFTRAAAKDLPKLDRPQTPKPPFPYRSEDVAWSHAPTEALPATFRAEATPKDPARVTLVGTLTLPRGDGPFPAAVLISGSGPQDRDETLLGHKPFAVIADHLTRRGFAVLRYDDRGVAKSTGDFGKATTLDFARDAASAVLYLASRKEIDGDKIGLIGHSEGGLVAPLVAAGGADDSHVPAAVGDRVAFAVLIAGPGVDGSEIIVHQTKLILRASSMSAEFIERNTALQRDVHALIRAGKLDEEDLTSAVKARFERHFDSLPAGQRGGMTRDQWVGMQLRQSLSPWVRFFLGHDPQPALRRMKCPTLALFGAKDLQVDPAQNAGPIATALAAGPCSDYAVVTLPRLNHLLQQCATGSPQEYARIPHTIHGSALRTMTDWLALRFLPQAPAKAAPPQQPATDDDE